MLMLLQKHPKKKIGLWFAILHHLALYVFVFFLVQILLLVFALAIVIPEVVVGLTRLREVLGFAVVRLIGN